MFELWSLWFFFGTLGAGVAVLLGIIWYDPMGRLENDLALAVIHVDRVVQDGLRQLHCADISDDAPRFVYVNPIGGQTERLRNLSSENLILLDGEAEMVREQLLMHIDAWNQGAGQMASYQAAKTILMEMSKPTTYLCRILSNEARLQAEHKVYDGCLFQAVGTAENTRKTIH